MDIAALTHGAPSGFTTAADAALITAELLDAEDVATGLPAGISRIADVDGGVDRAERYAMSARDGRNSPAQISLLSEHAPARAASAALCGALYVAASFPRANQIIDALTFAAQAPGAGVAAVAGALLGAVHGVDALSPAIVSRLELAWVADALARDAMSELMDAPGGHETWTESQPGTFQAGWQEGSEPNWWHRYPGW
jgi:hypothetical protein